MNAVLKKKIVNISSDTLAIFTLISASVCIGLKTKSYFPLNTEKINMFAATYFFYKSNFKPLAFSKNIFDNNSEKINIKDFYGNNNKETNFSVNSNAYSPSNIKLPDFKGDSDNNSEYHSPDEAKYKIIETNIGAGGTKFENFYLKNITGQDIDIQAELNKAPEINITNTKEPQVLIFHTHTSESYMKKDDGFFYESFYPRSLDNEKNVTRVGREIVEKLKENGINAIHDTTYHDNPSYNGSYSRSAKTIKENLEKYPSIQVVIDIHRDSMGSKEQGKVKPTFKYKDKKAAQLMIISGCDPDKSLGFPNWEKNLRLALRIQKCCETLFPGITRPLNFSKVKYNEHLTPGSLLIEIGSDANTLEEAVNTGAMLGEALSQVLNGLKK